MEQTGTNQCLVFVGSMETHVADRIEDYARQNDMMSLILYLRMIKP